MTLKIPGEDTASDDGASTDEVRPIGQTIGAVRRRRRMSAAELARAANLSPGAISQIESGTTQPSLPAVYRIARALGVPTFQLFMEDEHSEGHVVRRNGPRARRGRGQVAFNVLTPGRGGDLEVIEIRLSPGQSTADAPVAHPGEECVVVIEGHILVEVGDTKYELSHGDAVTFRGETPHRVLNPDGSIAVAISIVTKIGSVPNS